MESLFETNQVNTQPLRKYEPLIRFDLEGNPQPRKLLKDLDTKKPSQSPALQQPKEQLKQLEKKEPQPEVRNEDPPQECLKRKSDALPPKEAEPKKKQQKQTSIMAFFAKK